MLTTKIKLEDYTEEEFLIFLKEFFENTSGITGEAHGEYMDKLLDHFILITEHPAKSDVICYPQEGREDSPEGVLKEVKEWRALHGKPGFKSS